MPTAGSHTAASAFHASESRFSGIQLSGLHAGGKPCKPFVCHLLDDSIVLAPVAFGHFLCQRRPQNILVDNHGFLLHTRAACPPRRAPSRWRSRAWAMLHKAARTLV